MMQLLKKQQKGAVKGRFINCGQSCVASKRFFVGKNIADEFMELFIKKTSQLKIGDPTSMDRQILVLYQAKKVSKQFQEL